MNLEGRWETTTVIDESDHELYNAENNTVNIEKIKQIMTSGNKEELQTLLQTMNRMYFVNENVFSKEEGEALISVACDVILSITIDSSTVMGYTNLLSQLSDLHRW
ncbi:MAG: hypothetical protein LBU27_05885 [Candidatus Peribacteria bacterium]|jgi:hypothetical protein|nr:hypothetical protein [Candidatus Peribacteria bacterium]